MTIYEIAIQFQWTSETKMAKLCVSSGSLSAFIVLILGVCTSLAIQVSDRVLDDGRLRYQIYSNHPDVSSEIAEIHTISKRFAQQLTNETKASLLAAGGATSQAPPTALPTVATPRIEKNSDENRSSGGPGVENSSSAEEKVDNLAPPPTKGNVGVNGTGIRLTTTVSTAATPTNGTSTTLAPPFVEGNIVQHVVSEPISPGADISSSPDVRLSGSDKTVDDDVAELPQDPKNTTLILHNITRNEIDYHDYYNSSFLVDEKTGRQYWEELNTNATQVHVSDLLSQSHRRAVTVQLSFDFPFYGHPVRNVTVATGGFLYTGDYVHSWLAATQYIAPLMANFDTSLSNDSFVKYYDNGTAFTVVWEKVALQEKPTEGGFTFSATLHKTGDIVFVYQHVPVMIENIDDDRHPVKVGLSDAYIIDRTIFFARRKTIYEYHRVNFRREDIRDWTIIYLWALPTCLNHKDCESCMRQTTNFECTWCPSTNRCSTGMDRHRQDWLQKGCNKTQIGTADQCPARGSPGNSATMADSTIPDERSSAHLAAHEGPAPARSGHVTGTVAALVPLCLVVVLGAWLFYAYRNPHTKSGQILIRYRPSQWTWRRGEARYTAATIHM